MKSSYSFLLQHTNMRLYNRIAYIVTALNFLFFCYLSFNTDTGKYTFFLFLILLSFGFEWGYKKYIKAQYYFFPNYLLLLAGWIFLYPNYLMILLHCILAMMDVLVRQKNYLHFNEYAVTQARGSFKKQYGWELFSNIILKDGLLTLDFKNNQIQQYHIGEQLNEEGFNNFCRQYLTA